MLQGLLFSYSGSPSMATESWALQSDETSTTFAKDVASVKLSAATLPHPFLCYRCLDLCHLRYAQMAFAMEMPPSLGRRRRSWVGEAHRGRLG